MQLEIEYKICSFLQRVTSNSPRLLYYIAQRQLVYLLLYRLYYIGTYKKFNQRNILHFNNIYILWHYNIYFILIGSWNDISFKLEIELMEERRTIPTLSNSTILTPSRETTVTTLVRLIKNVPTIKFIFTSIIPLSLDSTIVICKKIFLFINTCFRSVF